MNLNLSAKKIPEVSCPTLVVFAKEGDSKSEKARILNSELAKKLSGAIDDGSVTGKSNEVTVFRHINWHHYKNVVVVGIGKANDFNHERARQAAAEAYSAVKSLRTDAVLDLDGLIVNKRNSPQTVQAAAEGILLASYSYDELKSKKDEDKNKNLTLHLLTVQAKQASVKKAFDAGVILAETVNFSRTLGDTPANMMTPDILARRAAAAAKGTGIKVTIWDKARIKRERMGGLLGVSQGSAQEPRFIIMEYKGAAKSKKPIVFVGKGLTFDCGGISIKPSASMEEMKYDMCGGANVIGAILAIAKLKLKVNVTVLVPATENLVGPSATKPGDVHTARNGKTFEVNNTDAEGRLILADALSYATELEPEIIIDAATLTGAIVVALGNTHTGYFTRNDSLAREIEKAAESSGEWVWRMPLTDHHVKDMKGTFADLSNISGGKGAGSATAAAFLEQFVGENIPWAHFDIAGTAWAIGNRLNYCPKKGASGVMIRTFVELAKSRQ